MKKNNIEKDIFEDILKSLGQEKYIEIKKELGIPLERYEILIDSYCISPSFFVRRLFLNDKRRNNNKSNKY